MRTTKSSTSYGVAILSLWMFLYDVTQLLHNTQMDLWVTKVLKN